MDRKYILSLFNKPIYLMQVFAMALVLLLHPVSPTMAKQLIHLDQRKGRSLGFDIAVDQASNIYVTGSRWRNRNVNVWLGKYNFQGQIWEVTLEGPAREWAQGLATDQAGNVYLTGVTSGNLGGPNAGGEDIWYAKYNSNGQRLWLKQFGSKRDDGSQGIATDQAGNVYLTGATSGNLGGPNAGGKDIWYAKYNSNGQRLWLKQFGSKRDDGSQGIATDQAGNVYLTGATSGNLGGPNVGGEDIWYAKYNSNGQRLWLKQFGSKRDDGSQGIATDQAGNVYLTGWTKASLDGPNAGGFDIWLAKYNSNGQCLWLKQFGSEADDFGYDMATDQAGDVYLTGATSGNLGGPNVGGEDIWYAKYSSNGQRLWLKQFGSEADDGSRGIATDQAGNAYLTGSTSGGLGHKPNSTNIEAFIMKLDALGN